ncbi:hypothetical protein, partial [Paenibacillus timonensis]|uniref:hypothetical protein n=1 Tax=Paenibacillus timonensis TaxID=225915 RepID=UPI0022E1C481
KDTTDPPLQLATSLFTFAGFSLGPFVIAASGYFKGFAHLRDSALEAMIVDEGIDQRRSLAK